ncbi:MAG: dienelactone hydrolase family protein [Planctomyces sp.]
MLRLFKCSLLTLLLALPCSTLQADPLKSLEQWLTAAPLSNQRLSDLTTQTFANTPLSAEQATAATELLWRARRDFLKTERQAELDARQIVLGDLKMPFWYRSFGDPPASGRRLFISMHGGGGAPPAVNDQQYENQKRLYQPAEGIYLVPRAATNTWDLWHQAHIDQFFDRLITDMIVLENVNPDQVFIMGYSAGGDGVYQLAPRMADRLAAAAMMAGHPNEARPEGLRNIGFTIHMGAQDSAYGRNSVAADWGRRLKTLKDADPQGYVHSVTLHEGKGHWMNLEDKVAVPWMSEFTRQPWPARVVWVQDDVVHNRFYWLQVEPGTAKAGDQIIAEVHDGKVRITACSRADITLLLSDRLLPLDAPLTVELPDGTSQVVPVQRRLSVMAASLLERNDPAGIASATVSLAVPVKP